MVYSESLSKISRAAKSRAKYSGRFFYLLFVQGRLYLLEFKMCLVWISAFYDGTEEDSQVGNEANLEAK